MYPIDGFLIGGYDDRCYSEVLPADILEAITHINYYGETEILTHRKYKYGKCLEAQKQMLNS